MQIRHIIYVLGLFCLSSCASHLPVASNTTKALAFASLQQQSLAARFSPIVIPDQAQTSYNRVGMPVAAYDKHGNEKITVSSEHPVFYFQQIDFTTEQASYTNLIYRIHFEGTPFYHLTSGDNVGIFIIVTLDALHHPILITTVHTCGCYLAFTPTQYMPDSAFPKGWNKTEQHIYGQTLPGFMQWQDQDERLLIKLEDGTHRVRDIQTIKLAETSIAMQMIATAIKPMAELKRLPLGKTTTSFFIHAGDHKGYVKGSSKPWEFLLMSWWALDRNIGVDKDYGDAATTGTLFYTDLNPKHRVDSDMWPFANFLHYWGWGL